MDSSRHHPTIALINFIQQDTWQKKDRIKKIDKIGYYMLQAFGPKEKKSV